MKNLALFSKDKSKKLKCHLLQFLFGTSRVKGRFLEFLVYYSFVDFFLYCRMAVCGNKEINNVSLKLSCLKYKINCFARDSNSASHTTCS